MLLGCRKAAWTPRLGVRAGGAELNRAVTAAPKAGQRGGRGQALSGWKEGTPVCPEWQEAWSCYLQAMQGGRFFAAHEALEPLWRIDRHPTVRCAIWWAVLFHHWQRGNFAGAMKMLDKLRRGCLLSLPDAVWRSLGERMAAGDQLEVQRDLWQVLQALSSAVAGISSNQGENNRCGKCAGKGGSPSAPSLL